MTVYERSTVVDAPFEDVWGFHTSVDGLVEVTPRWMNLRVESVVGPDGERDVEEFEEGTEVSLSIRPFGIAPRQSWNSRIVEREDGEGRAHFRDRMRDGPFHRWEHTHRFAAVEGGTRMTDHVEYALKRPLDPLSGVGYPMMDLLFRDRHRRTRDVLE